MKTLIYWLFMCIAILCIGCTDNTEICKYNPKIFENNQSGTQELSNRVKEIFLNFDYPAGVIPILYYTPEITPLIEVGSYADEKFDELTAQLPEKNDFEERGMLIIISDSPQLIQIRMGDRYRVYCNMSGATMGPDYLELQKQLSTKTIADVLPSFLQQTCVRVTELNSLSTYKKFRTKDVLAFVSNFLDYTSTPTENFYGKFIMRPTLILQSFFYHFIENLVISIGLSILILLIIRYGLHIIVDLCFHKTPSLQTILHFLLKWGLGILFSVSMAGSAMLLSSGRMEDIIALHALNIPYIESISYSLADYSVGASIFTIISFVFLYILKMTFCNDLFLMNLLPESQQKQQFNQQSEWQKAILVGLHQADLKKVEESSTPYSEIFQTSFGQNVGIRITSLTVAALFLLPQCVLYVGIALALISLIKTGIHIYRLIYLGNIPKNERLYSKISIIGFIILVIGITGFSFILAYIFNPLPDKKEIDFSQTTSIVINPTILEGKYTIEKRFNDKSSYGSAVIKKENENTYRLLVTGKSDPQIFILILDEKNLCFTSEDLGIGQIHHDRELNTTKITFNNNNLLWELSK